MQPITADQALYLLQIETPHLEHEHKVTQRVLAAVPADKGNFQPDPRSMTAMDLSWHTASAECFFLHGVIHGEFTSSPKPEWVKTPADVAKWYTSEFAELYAKLPALSGEQLARTIQFHHFNLPGIAYLRFLLDHSIHHRGQLSAYLRPMGAKVPAIYGGSADEPFTAPDSAAEGQTA